ncbi:MAG: hypothetical protein ABMB14_10675 [Myxococcota bacterium]
MIALLAIGCRGATDPGVATARIAAAQPTLQAMAARKVTQLRDQGWCRGIVYDRGAFATSTNPSTCTVSGAPIDPTAEQDLSAFAHDLRATGIDLLEVAIGYDPGGAIATVDLWMSVGVLAGAHYAYAPADPPVSMGSELQVTPLSGGWFLMLEDWN